MSRVYWGDVFHADKGFELETRLSVVVVFTHHLIRHGDKMRDATIQDVEPILFNCWASRGNVADTLMSSTLYHHQTNIVSTSRVCWTTISFTISSRTWFYAEKGH